MLYTDKNNVVYIMRYSYYSGKVLLCETFFNSQFRLFGYDIGNKCRKHSNGLYMEDKRLCTVTRFELTTFEIRLLYLPGFTGLG